MNKLERDMNRFFSFVIGLLLGLTILATLQVLVDLKDQRLMANSKMRYLPARSILITP